MHAALAAFRFLPGRHSRQSCRTVVLRRRRRLWLEVWAVMMATVDSLVLHLESLVSNLESVHLFDRLFGCHDRIVRHETCMAYTRKKNVD